jgi:hypothetical protein
MVNGSAYTITHPGLPFNLAFHGRVGDPAVCTQIDQPLDGPAGAAASHDATQYSTTAAGTAKTDTGRLPIMGDLGWLMDRWNGGMVGWGSPVGCMNIYIWLLDISAGMRTHIDITHQTTNLLGLEYIYENHHASIPAGKTTLVTRPCDAINMTHASNHCTSPVHHMPAVTK